MRLSAQRGAATVEHAAISLLIALCWSPPRSRRSAPAPTGAAASSARRSVRKLRCAAVGPGPCWRDPLTVAYGRSLAGAVRALAPAPVAAAGPAGAAAAGRLSPLPLAVVRRRRGRGRGSPPRTGASPSSSRSPTRGEADGSVRSPYWLYRPDARVGAGRAARRASAGGRAARPDAAAGRRGPGAGAARDPRRPQSVRVRRPARNRRGAGGVVPSGHPPIERLTSPRAGLPVGVVVLHHAEALRRARARRGACR